MRCLTLLALFCIALSANILQEAIDKAAAGSRLDLPKGVFKGTITIDKPLMLVGHGTTIDGLGKGTVI